MVSYRSLHEFLGHIIIVQGREQTTWESLPYAYLARHIQSHDATTKREYSMLQTIVKSNKLLFRSCTIVCQVLKTTF